MKKNTFKNKVLSIMVMITVLLVSVSFMNIASAQDSNLTVAYPDVTPVPTTESTTSPNKYTAENPLKLLCIGDSITHGCGVADEEKTKRYHTSYRYPLWKKFIDNNYHVEFVGNRSMNFDANCNELGSEYKGHIFNNKHEAHYGITLYDVLNGYTPTSKNENTMDANGNYVAPIVTVPPLREEISNLDFNAVVINLGTNTRTVDGEIYETDEIKADEMKQVTGVLREKNPNVVIYITQLLALDTFDSLNTYYQKIADTMSTDASPIICMRTKNPRWNTGDFYLSYIDGIHPDAYGDDYLSEIVLNYMRPLLEGSSDVKSLEEPFEIYPVEKPVKPKKIKLLTKRITPKTKVVKGKTNVKDATVVIKAGKKTIKEVYTNNKGTFKARVNLKKYKPGKILTFRAIKYYEAYDYSEIVKKSPVLKVKIKKAK